jgi:crotonobetainyl-CoA:carnitine CoA-transferase CaiB-like acyl-CoA transferase
LRLLMQPLANKLVVDLTRYLPGPFASRELLRLGARVVVVEPPDGDPMRASAPGWYAALNVGKESVVCDLKDPDGLALAQALVDRADVALEGFRPGVLDRLGLRVPDGAVLCSISGFGIGGPHAQRVGHDVNYLGFAGALADTAPVLPPVQVADLAAGALGAVVEILAALLAGGGARITVSMTHNSHRLVAHRLVGDPMPRMLTGGPPCYAIYGTADGRWLTVGALERKFWKRLCELIEREDLEARQWDETAADELEGLFRQRSLAEWLELFGDEEVCVGPVLTIAEAADELGSDPPAGKPAPGLGEHTQLWRNQLGL